MELNQLLFETVKSGASDLHLKHGARPIIRRHGQLEPLPTVANKMSSDLIAQMAFSIMSETQKQKFASEMQIDMGHGVKGVGRFRVNVFKTRGSVQMAFRSIPREIPSFMQLGLPPVLESIASYERGLVLITGVTGSGKSTTMASMLNHINNTKNCHIITVEDPIEYLLPDHKSIISQRELGSDTPTFSGAVRAALRQDPDVIVVGEIRDRDTLDTVLLAAETGHLVISTLHTADARETLNRLLVYYEPHHQMQVRIQLASVLRAVISQRLATTADGQGVVPAVEVLLNTARIRGYILDAKRTHEITSAIEDGHITHSMQSFDQSLLSLLNKKVITLSEALQLSSHPDDFLLRAKGVVSGHESVMPTHTVTNFWSEVPRLELEPLQTSEAFKSKDESLPPVPTGGKNKK